MSKSVCLVDQAEQGWHLISLGDPLQVSRIAQDRVESGPDGLAECIEQFVRENGLRRKSIVIGVHSCSAFAASFALPDTGVARDRRQLEYRFEESLPIAAEDFTADFICDGNRSLGVAIRNSEFEPIVVALEQRGLEIMSISPSALLALQSYTAENPDESFDVILWYADEHLDYFRMQESRLTNWLHLSCRSDEVTRELAFDSLNAGRSIRVLAINAEETSQEFLRKLPDVELQTRDAASLQEYSLRTADLIVGDNREPMIELRRGLLNANAPLRAISGPLRVFFTAAMFLLLSSAVAFEIRAFQYDRRAKQLHETQIEHFREAFPRASVPSGVVSRLQSEQSKLKGARGQSPDIQPPTPALNVLYEVLAALPDKVRFRLTELMIEDGVINLRVDLQSHGQAAVFVGLLQERGFAVSPPSMTQDDDDTVTADIRAEFRADDSGPGGSQ